MTTFLATGGAAALQNDKLQDVFRVVGGGDGAAAEGGGGGIILTVLLVVVAVTCLVFAARHWAQLRESKAYQRWLLERRAMAAMQLDRPTRRALRQAARAHGVGGPLPLLCSPSLLTQAAARLPADRRSLLAGLAD